MLTRYLKATLFCAAGMCLTACDFDVTLVDPESMLQIGNGQGFESYGMPATRSIGFNLNVKF